MACRGREGGCWACQACKIARRAGWRSSARGPYRALTAQPPSLSIRHSNACHSLSERRDVIRAARFTPLTPPQVILLRVETSPEDVGGMHAAEVRQQPSRAGTDLSQWAATKGPCKAGCTGLALPVHLTNSACPHFTHTHSLGRVSSRPVAA